MKSKFILLGTFITITLFSGCNGSDNGTISKKETVLSVIHGRKSVRSFIKDRPVSDEDAKTLVKAGMAAPSGKDTRPWEFIIINNRNILDKLAEELPTAKMLSQAPMAIVVCGDTTKSSYWYLDCSAATQNILLTAEALDLGAVWTAAYPYPDRMGTVSKNISLPSHILPLVVIPVGYPMGPQSVKDKYDEKKVHMDKW
ncbi:nitroreductase family protein [Dysgonomonas sp. GY75]|uniref:nitroreductase family protein n=1 Tax=Dysgonomonas sp. GY75 TaxID=2780419 RepID=UPI0018843253|nr:nitroreductase family protein [Dysgonomonas sp. GY75]MBF0647636.1 nitroreductase family protein [Dysgonomonas sp. GY75]